MTVHDLALAEVGAAHRAAQQFRDADKWKELKRLQNAELANTRGKAALGKTMTERQVKVQAVEDVRKRKVQVRMEEDRKVREMIEEQKKMRNIRKPFHVISDS
jgi:hypothetical protein